MDSLNNQALGRSVEWLRRLFPSLSNEFARFDGPGASQVPAVVIDAISEYLRTSNARPGATTPQSRATTALIVEARQALAAFLGGATDEVGFGWNATAVNAQLVAAATRRLHSGDEIVVTQLDHNSNLAPWRQAASDRGLVVRTAPVATDTLLDMDALRALIGERTRIVAFPWANNAVGTMTDVRAITELAHAAGAVAWCDATHYLPHGPVSAHESGVDVLVGSAYKFFGPHLGVFYIRAALARQWQPDDTTTVAASGLEPGTLPFEVIPGLIAALRYLREVGWEFVQAAEKRLGERFLAGLPTQWQLHGLPTMQGRTATFALTLPGRDSFELANELAARNIATSAGDIESPEILRAGGLQNVLRAGILHYTSEAEVDRLLAALTDLAGQGAQ